MPAIIILFHSKQIRECVRKSVKIEWRLCRRGFWADEDEETKSLDINIDDKNIPSV